MIRRIHITLLCSILITLLSCIIMTVSMLLAPQAHSQGNTVTYTLTTQGETTPTMIFYTSQSEEIYDMETPPYSVTACTYGTPSMRAYTTTYVWPHYTCTITINGVVAAHNTGHGGVACNVGVDHA